MGQDVKNQTRFCQKPSTLMTRETWRQKLLTITMSWSEDKIAALLQLATAFLFLLLGLIKFNALQITGEIYFELYRHPMDYYSEPDLAWSFNTLLSFVFLPLVLSAVGFGLFYRIGKSDKNAWKLALLFNFFGFLLVLFTFLPFIQIIQGLFSLPEPGTGSFFDDPFLAQFHSYDSIWVILSYLIPLAVILNLALVIYLSFGRELFE